MRWLAIGWFTIICGCMCAEPQGAASGSTGGGGASMSQDVFECVATGGDGWCDEMIDTAKNRTQCELSGVVRRDCPIYTVGCCDGEKYDAETDSFVPWQTCWGKDPDGIHEQGCIYQANGKWTSGGR